MDTLYEYGWVCHDLHCAVLAWCANSHITSRLWNILSFVWYFECFFGSKTILSKCSSRCFEWMPNPWFPYFLGFNQRLNTNDLKWSDPELRRGVARPFLARQGPKMAYLADLFPQISHQVQNVGLFCTEWLSKPSHSIGLGNSTFYARPRVLSLACSSQCFSQVVIPGKQGAISDMFFTFFFHAGSWTNFEINFGGFLSHYYGLQPSFNVFKFGRNKYWKR